MEEFWKPAWPPCHSWPGIACYVLQGCKGGHTCNRRGKENWHKWRDEGMSWLLIKKLTPIQAGQRGRGVLGKPFPWGKLMPRLDNISSCFLCLSFVPPIHRKDSSKTQSFVFLLACLNEGGVSRLAVGNVCSHTVERRHAPPGCSIRAQLPTVWAAGKLRARKRGEFCGQSASSKIREVFRMILRNTFCLWRCWIQPQRLLDSPFIRGSVKHLPLTGGQSPFILVVYGQYLHKSRR